MNQRVIRKTQDPSLPVGDPPSSPPTTFLLINKKMIQVTAQQQKTTTLNPRDPAGT
jgi:hypothetical protein